MRCAKMASAEGTRMASAEMAPTKVRPAEMRCAEMASAEAAEMASTKMSSTEAANMASAEASAMTSADPASSKVASASSTPTTSAKRHHTVRHGENTECDAYHQRHEGAARDDSVWHDDFSCSLAAGAPQSARPGIAALSQKKVFTDPSVSVVVAR